MWMISSYLFLGNNGGLLLLKPESAIAASNTTPVSDTAKFVQASGAWHVPPSPRDISNSILPQYSKTGFLLLFTGLKFTCIGWTTNVGCR